jgi:hypothetical protein
MTDPYLPLTVYDRCMARAIHLAAQEQPMVLPIRQAFIPAGNPNRPGAKLTAAPLWITVHETGNANVGANAEMHRRFTHQGGGPNTVSFHFVVDDREAVQLLPLDEIGWHASDGCNDRATDLGCFQSVAIETCVNGDGDWNRTFANLAELIAAIIGGDARIWFAGRHRTFSPSRIAQHNKWAFDQKDCPQRIRARGLWDDLLAAVVARLGPPTTTPTPATTTTAPPQLPGADARLPPGMTPAMARERFGKVVTGNGVYDYQPTGALTNLWVNECRVTGRWPAIVHVVDIGFPRFYTFADGSIVIIERDTPPRWLRV